MLMTDNRGLSPTYKNSALGLERSSAQTGPNRPSVSYFSSVTRLVSTVPPASNLYR